jgi:phosphopantetheine--protein transferase-like protein
MESTAPGRRGSIIGIGVDVVDVARFHRLVSARGDSFIQRWFTRRERSQCERGPRNVEAYAARFAVKEAVWKTLGVGEWRQPLAWRSIEVLTDRGDGALHVILHRAAAEHALHAGAASFQATVSIAGGVATAITLASRRCV